jgi:hypothetical protein
MRIGKAKANSRDNHDFDRTDRRAFNAHSVDAGTLIGGVASLVIKASV